MRKFYCAEELRQLTEDEVIVKFHCGRCQFDGYAEEAKHRLRRNEPLRFNRLEVVFRNGFKPT